MDTKTIKDIMIPLGEYPHIKHDKTVAEAMSLMENTQITQGGRKSLPRLVLVFDDLGVVVGVIGRRDIIRGMEPDYMSVTPENYSKRLFDVGVDPNLIQLSFDKTLKSFQQKAKKRVYELMVPLKAFVDQDAPLLSAIGFIVEEDVSILPVVKGDSVVGVIRTAEVFREIGRWLKI